MWTTLKLLINIHLKTFLRQIKSQTSGRILIIFFFLLLYSSVAYGIYHVVLAGLTLIFSNAFYGQAFFLYLLEILLAVIFLLIVFSTVLMLNFSSFKSKKQQFIVASSKYPVLAWFILYEVITGMLIPFLSLFLPLLLALIVFFKLGPFACLILIINLASYITMSVLVGTFIYLLASCVFICLNKKPYLVKKSFIMLVAMVFILIFAYLIFKIALPRDFFQIWEIDASQKIFEYKKIQERFQFLPTHFSANVILYTELSIPFKALLALLVNFLIIAWLLLFSLLFFKKFLIIWQILQEGSYHAATLMSEKKLGQSRKIPFYTHDQLGIIFEKEFKIFFRDHQDTSFLIFIFSIWFFYFALNFVIKHNIDYYHLDMSALPFSIHAIQVLFNIYFITTLALRFIFPTLSLEQKRAWIIASAPINFKLIFKAKTYFYSLLFLLLALLMGMLNLMIFPLTGVDLLFYLLIYLVSVMTIVFFNLFFAFVFPNFETENKELISSSLSGILCTLLAIMHGGCGAYLLHHYLTTGAYQGIIFYCLLSPILIIMIENIIPFKLKKIEFEGNLLHA